MLTGSRTTRPLGALLAGVTLAGAAAVSLASPASAATGGVLVHGLTAANQLVQFRADTPGTTIGSPVAIAGLASTDDVVGIDVRPASGALYAVVDSSTGNGDRVISVNPATGAVLSTINLSRQLAGTSFGTDFNPQADRLRIVSDTLFNFNVNVDTGVVTEQGTLTPTSSDVRAAAYANNAPTLSPVRLLDIDISGADRLAQQDPATGVLTPVGATGVDVPQSGTPSVGLDVEARTNVGYAVFEVTDGSDAFYRVNTDTGAATLVGAFVTASEVEDVAVASPRYSVSDAVANEGSSAQVTVTRVGDTSDTATILLTPSTGGTAGSAATTDFDTASKTVTLAIGQTTATVPVALTADALTEPSETFTVTIAVQSDSGGNATTADATGIVTILDGPARNTLGRFHPLTPARIFDTRTTGNRVIAGADRAVQVTGQGGVPATGVTAVVLNVTVTNASARGDLQVYPTGQRPTNRTSNLNYFAGETVPVQVQTGVGTGGQVSVSVNTGNAQVIVDVFGYYGDASDTIAGSSGYTALQPQRLLDTRTTRTPVVAGNDRTVIVGGNLGVPATATAVILNTTVLGTPANADLQVYPTGARPTNRTSNLNLRRGQTKANSVTVALGTNGSINLSVSQNSAQVVLDVLGYYSTESRGRFIALTPSRVFDTRSTTPQSPIRAGSDRNVTVGGQGGVPAGAAAAVLSVTGTGASNPVDLQVFPTGNRPTNRTSTINFRPGEAVANVAVATLGTNGQVTLSLSQGSATVILDAVGYILND